MTVKDHYENFAGTVRWVIDKDGVGKIQLRLPLHGGQS